MNLGNKFLDVQIRHPITFIRIIQIPRKNIIKYHPLSQREGISHLHPTASVRYKSPLLAAGRFFFATPSIKNGRSAIWTLSLPFCLCLYGLVSIIFPDSTNDGCTGGSFKRCPLLFSTFIGTMRLHTRIVPHWAIWPDMNSQMAITIPYNTLLLPVYSCLISAVHGHFLSIPPQLLQLFSKLFINFKYVIIKNPVTM